MNSFCYPRMTSFQTFDCAALYASSHHRLNDRLHVLINQAAKKQKSCKVSNRFKKARNLIFVKSPKESIHLKPNLIQRRGGGGGGGSNFHCIGCRGRATYLGQFFISTESFGVEFFQH